MALGFEVRVVTPAEGVVWKRRSWTPKSAERDLDMALRTLGFIIAKQIVLNDGAALSPEFYRQAKQMTAEVWAAGRRHTVLNMWDVVYEHAERPHVPVSVVSFSP